MDAYILETLRTRNWRREGEIYWALEDAEQFARTLLKRKVAKKIRILPAKVSPVAVVELPKTPDEARGAYQ